MINLQQHQLYSEVLNDVMTDNELINLVTFLWPKYKASAYEETYYATYPFDSLRDIN